MSRVLIAGPGYIGSNLAKVLKDENKVYTLSRSGFDLPDTVSLRFDLREVMPKKFLPEVDEVYFCLAPKSRDLSHYRSTFVDSLNHLLDGLSGTFRFTFISSTSVYGENAGEWVTEDSPVHKDISAYGKILREAESIVLKRCTESVIVRFGGIYGPGRESLIQRILAGKEALTPTPKYTNRIHRDDCTCILLFLRDHRLRGIYNGVDDDPCDKNILIKWVQNHKNLKPRELGYSETAGMNKRVSNEKIKSLGFQFKYPSFREGYASLLN